MAQDNARAVETLLCHVGLWRLVCGPDPNSLQSPTEDLVARAQQAAARLQDLHFSVAEMEKGHESFALDLQTAVAKIRVTSWDSIRRERFSLTPEALFDELVRIAEQLLRRHAGDIERRRLRLAAAAFSHEATQQGEQAPGNQPVQEVEDEGEGEVDEEAVGLGPNRADCYGLDLDEFKLRRNRKPVGWDEAVALASEVHLDQMRSLLEMHYDEVHQEKWRQQAEAKNKKVPARKGEHARILVVEAQR